jgi:hypothetical protein
MKYASGKSIAGMIRHAFVARKACLNFDLKKGLG